MPVFCLCRCAPSRSSPLPAESQGSTLPELGSYSCRGHGYLEGEAQTLEKVERALKEYALSSMHNSQHCASEILVFFNVLPTVNAGVRSCISLFEIVYRFVFFLSKCTQMAFVLQKTNFRTSAHEKRALKVFSSKRTPYLYFITSDSALFVLTETSRLLNAMFVTDVVS
jgi:hypothetical protein